MPIQRMEHCEKPGEAGLGQELPGAKNMEAPLEVPLNALRRFRRAAAPYVDLETLERIEPLVSGKQVAENTKRAQ